MCFGWNLDASCLLFCLSVGPCAASLVSTPSPRKREIVLHVHAMSVGGWLAKEGLSRVTSEILVWLGGQVKELVGGHCCLEYYHSFFCCRCYVQKCPAGKRARERELKAGLMCLRLQLSSASSLDFPLPPIPRPADPSNRSRTIKCSRSSSTSARLRSHPQVWLCGCVGGSRNWSMPNGN